MALISNALSKPITLKLSGKVIPNRLYRSPLSEYAAVYDQNNPGNTGMPSEKYVELYQNGGVGMIFFGNITVDRDHLEEAGNACLDARSDWDHAKAFEPAIRAAKSRGALCLPQLQFPGRQVPANINPNPLSSSDVQLEPSMGKVYAKPRALSRAEIKDMVRKFAWAAEKCAQAGADGVMLHACHGYIITQFLSPHINHRTDEYGGTLENRARFLMELVEAIRAKLPIDKFVIAVKLNCQDFIEGGQSFAEQTVVMKWLENAGVDFFDISGGTYASPAWRGDVKPELTDRPLQREFGSYFLEWAREMKSVLSRAVIGTTGGWRDAARMEEAVAKGWIDMCGLARPLQEDPFLVNKLLEGKLCAPKL